MYLFLEREGRKRGREASMCGCLSNTPTRDLTWPTTQACALTGTPTGDPLVHRPVLNPLSHSSHGRKRHFPSYSGQWGSLHSLQTEIPSQLPRSASLTRPWKDRLILWLAHRVCGDVGDPWRSVSQQVTIISTTFILLVNCPMSSPYSDLCKWHCGTKSILCISWSIKLSPISVGHQTAGRNQPAKQIRMNH